MKKLTPRMLGVVALVALTTSLTAVSAQAADTAPDDAAAAVALNAQVQSGAIAASALTPSQIDLLSRFGTVARTDTKTTITPISTSDPRVADAVAGVKAKVGVAAAAAIECKQARGERVATSAAGNNLYMSYHVGAWCYSYTPPVGLITVTSATSLSADPPSMICCVNKTSRSHDAILQAGAFAANVIAAQDKAPESLSNGDDAEIVAKHIGEFEAQGVPHRLAADVALGLYRYSLLDIIDVADITERDADEVADTYFALMDRLGTDGLLTAVAQLPRDDRWHALARLAIRDDIYNSVRSLCLDVLAVGEPDEDGMQKITEWESTNASRVARARRTLTQIYESDQRDLATLSVAARQIRSMTRASGRGAASPSRRCPGRR